MLLSRGVQRSDDARVKYLFVCPTSSIGECKKYRQILRNVRNTGKENYLPKLLPVKKDCATKTSPQLTIKKRKSLYESRTTQQ